jgi:hypothetical protein
MHEEYQFEPLFFKHVPEVPLFYVVTAKLGVDGPLPGWYPFKRNWGKPRNAA